MRTRAAPEHKATSGHKVQQVIVERATVPERAAPKHKTTSGQQEKQAVIYQSNEPSGAAREEEPNVTQKEDGRADRAAVARAR